MNTIAHHPRRALAVATLAAAAALAGCQKTTTTTTTPGGGTTTTTTVGTAPIPDLSASAAVAADRAVAGASQALGVAGASASQALGVAGAKLDDAAVTAKVKTALMAAAEVKALTIDVDTKDGRVTLNGTQDNAAAVERAVAVARGTDGVAGVDNKLTVRAP